MIPGAPYVEGLRDLAFEPLDVRGTREGHEAHGAISEAGAKLLAHPRG